MAIPADIIVRVHPIVLNPGGTSLVFNGLLLSKNPNIPLQIGIENAPNVPGILQFSSAKAVGQFFGYTSDEYKYAQTYFKGYNNSSRKPELLFVGRVVDTPAAPWVQGNKIVTMRNFSGLTAATFEIMFDNISVDITPINVSLATSFSEVAALLQTALITAAEAANVPEAGSIRVDYSSQTNTFKITGGESGTGHTITDLSGTLADAMAISSTQAVIPIYSVGMDAQTEEQTMERLTLSVTNWVSFAPLWDATDDECIAYGNWLNLYPVRFVFLPWRLDPAAPIPADASDLVSILKALGMEGVCCLYYDNYFLSAFVSGAIASVNYRTIQGAITYAFKAQAGLAYNVNDRETAVALRDKGWNFYGNYATANDRFIFFYQGSMTGQDWLWLDTYVNAIWLNNELQLAGMVTLTMLPRIPYIEDGYTYTRLGLMGPINHAAGRLGNGVIDVGVTLSEAQKAAVIQQAGEDITQDLFMYGFYLKVSDPAPEDRVQRLSPNIWLWYTYGGSVHRLDIQSVAIT